jgi:hypothetical protein
MVNPETLYDDTVVGRYFRVVHAICKSRVYTSGNIPGGSEVRWEAPDPSRYKLGHLVVIAHFTYGRKEGPRVHRSYINFSDGEGGLSMLVNGTQPALYEEDENLAEATAVLQAVLTEQQEVGRAVLEAA